jgi:hypothetical protein
MSSALFLLYKKIVVSLKNNCSKRKPKSDSALLLRVCAVLKSPLSIKENARDIPHDGHSTPKFSTYIQLRL